MSVIIVLTAFIMFATASLFYFLRGQAVAVQDPQELLALTHPVDLAAFRNLLDDDERFLEYNLAADNFHQIQKQRAQVILTYVKSLAHNAALLIKLGESARRSTDSE